METIEAGSENDIVDVIMRILSNEGPAPKKNLRDARKRRNGADQFNEDHQTEPQAKQSGDYIADFIHRQVDTIPKLNEELKKRKSTTTITTIKTNNKISNEFDPSCSACAQILTFNQLKKLNLKPRCPNGKESKSRPNYSWGACPKSKARSKNYPHAYYVEKTSNRTNGRIAKRVSHLRLTRIWINRSSQCSNPSMFNKKSKCTIYPSNCDTNVPKQMPTLVDQSEEPLNYAAGTCKSCHRVEKSNVSRDPSVSTYNSFMSVDHEPMD